MKCPFLGLYRELGHDSVGLHTNFMCLWILNNTAIVDSLGFVGL